MIEQPQGRKFSFTIPGRLGAWQRTNRNVARGITFTPAKMRSDKAMVLHFAVLAMRDKIRTPLLGPVRMVVTTWRQPPKSWSHKRQADALWITSKPDFDNTLKLIADALNKVAYNDDAQIAFGAHLKRYNMITPERVEIELMELEGP
jgi:Holliday junction resolvase RusA-like endonuclease